ncbi:hypothetical protein ACP3TJ_03650 [Desulforudis sp. 1088]|uniref:hypothetical protein n=1 Tax=unclassified Candidatus Desulforudis TaxID=2635950 RepID=UPI0034804EAC
MNHKVVERRCMLCGRTFVIESLEDVGEDDDLFPQEKKKSTSVCELCQAKLQKEAKGAQKIPKPI